MDAAYYRPAVSRLLLHGQRAAETLLTIQQWARECHAAHVRAGAAVPKGATAIANMLPARFGDPPGGHTSADNDAMAIHLLALRKETIPLCQHSTCAAEQARHWHRDCPRGGPRAEKTAARAHSFAIQDVEGDFYAAAFQHAIDSNDTERFDALCYLAGGKPVMLEDLSAASFCVGDAVEEHAIGEYLQCCQPTDTRFGVCGVGGTVNINTFKYPVSMLHAHEPDVSFMDKIAVGFGLSGPRPLLCIA
ncbi:hypothetical protein CYMTET_23124 [Cymbomonas tetramitiformis]|uniref:Uncharacterized protein n=1 Tax=Cymbomonas tetramitiformis TaxID=36881 RepID=A0AAE0L191_9CHLO|nr:hypothetical protein CYMTET_23124 [Cymbomonas tetramitiformis]